MRKIKFRVWDDFANKMLDWEDLISDSINFIAALNCEFSFPTMQYTGLTDKNGVEIYEGDVVTYLDGHDCSTENGQDFEEYQNKGVIEWDDEEARYTVSNRESIDLETFWLDIADSEVIGNIYENPELLEVKE